MEFSKPLVTKFLIRPTLKDDSNNFNSSDASPRRYWQKVDSNSYHWLIWKVVSCWDCSFCFHFRRLAISDNPKAPSAIFQSLKWGLLSFHLVEWIYPCTSWFYPAIFCLIIRHAWALMLTTSCRFSTGWIGFLFARLTRTSFGIIIVSLDFSSAASLGDPDFVFSTSLRSQ